MPLRDVTWKYDVDCGSSRSVWGIWDQCGDVETLWKLLSKEICVLGMNCVEKAWTRGRVKGKGKKEALKFLSDLDSVFARMVVDREDGLLEKWALTMKRLIVIVNKW
jgi:hypothetical protein